MHQLHKVPEEEIKNRLERLKKVLQAQEIDGVLITQNVDLYYFTGSLQNGVLFVPRFEDPCFYVKKSAARADFESSLSVEPLSRARELGDRLSARFGSIERIGMELDVLPYQLVQRYHRLFANAELVDLSYAIRKLRAVKSEYEIEQIRHAAKIVDEVIQSLQGWIHRGMTELQLAAEIEHALRLRGNSNLYRMRGFNQELVLGMVASGSAAATPTYFDGPAGGLGVSIANPQSASRKSFERGEPILIDISTVSEGYMVDQTRIAVIGGLPEELKQAYEVAQNILRTIEKLGKSGVSWGDLYHKAYEMVEDAGLEQHFMGFAEDQAKFLGHGVGLELDELPILAPRFTEPLQEGMVVAIEPKFTFPDRGVVGVENTYVVRKKGLEASTVSSEEVITCG